jgi:effector-binding domain-containing protein
MKKKESNHMNKDFNGFDEMVEALEENEDMVECKECFDLVPKVDCERAEVGYICPTCRGLRTAPAQARFVDPYDSYTQDFPEVTEYDPDSVVEYEKEPGLGDALADLIRDEYEAIDGYEVADETIQHADIDEDEKDEILDTLDHIKEEEEEHIDELKELCPECDPVAEPKAESEAESEKLEEAADDEVADKEAEVEEIPEEDIPEEEAEDSEENENEEVSDLESAYEAALEIANESGVGQVFGYARKETEEFVAIEPFEVDDPEAVEDDLMAVYDDVAYAYVAYPEKDLSEALFESVQLNEGPGRFLKGLGQKIGNAAKHIANKDSGKLIDKFFNEGYTLIFEGPKEGMPAEHKSEYDTADQALTAALHLSKEYPKYKIWVFAKPIDESDLTPREKTLAKAKNGLGAVIGCFRNGTALQKKDKEIADTLKKIEIDKQDLMKTTGRTAGESNGDPRDSVGEEDTEDNSEAEEDEDPNLDDEEEVTDPKDAAKKMLGEKKASDGYTPESYKKYEAAYAKIIAWIEAHNKPEALTQERIDNLRKQAEAKLVATPDEDPNLDDDEEEEVTGDNSQALDEAKAKAKETLGEKKAADAYTEESYATYSANYDKILAAIEGAESVEALEALNIVENKAKNEELLVEKTAEEEPSGTDVDSEEEEVDTEIGTEDEESAGEEKISEISDDRLIKLYQVLSGRQISSNAGVAKSQLKRLRQKLASLGESIDNNSSDEELLEVLQSEAEAVKSLKDTAASLKSTANSMQNMTSAMKESILNLSPADFAECVDSSRVELWGLEESEDGVAHAVLIQTYDDVSSEDVQTCHDKMLELDGMFTFCFTASGKPSLYGWNVEQLRELNQAGFKGISFDNPAYEEALSLAWHIK